MSTPERPSPFRRVLSRTPPSAFVLAVQALLLVLYAAYGDNDRGRAVIHAFGALVPALAVWVVTRSPSLNWIAWVLALPTMILTLLGAASPTPALLAWSSSLEATLYFYTAGSLIAYMMSDLHVTTDELYASGATFTLLAWGFAHAYLVCQIVSPGAFTGFREPGTERTFLELLFLSFTNLSATGLGDVLPLTPAARVLVMLEQVCGVGFIAVVVSRLIGLTIVRGARA